MPAAGALALPCAGQMAGQAGGPSTEDEGSTGLEAVRTILPWELCSAQPVCPYSGLEQTQAELRADGRGTLSHLHRAGQEMGARWAQASGEVTSTATFSDMQVRLWVAGTVPSTPAELDPPSRRQCKPGRALTQSQLPLIPL